MSSLGGGAVWSGAGAGIVLCESAGAGAFAASSFFEQPTRANISATVSKEIQVRIIVSSCAFTRSKEGALLRVPTRDRHESLTFH